MILKGKLKHSELEGGHWLLEGYQLLGLNFVSSVQVKDGLDVEVEGDLQENLMSIGMLAPILKVKRVKCLTD